MQDPGIDEDHELQALTIRSRGTPSAVPVSFSEFLVDVPPNQEREVDDLARHPPGVSTPVLAQPDIDVYCLDCRTLSRFRPVAREIPLVTPEARKDIIVEYECVRCRTARKIYSLRVRTPVKPDGRAWCLKYGEEPAYQPRAAPRLRRILGSEFEMFLQGRQSEVLGLGVGAFTYYRRVVEAQRTRIVEQFIKVAHKLGADATVVSSLEAAKDESQFSSALEALQGGIPPSLLFEGQNPLRLLYDTLSEGIHKQTDEQCLEAAHDVRVVLTALAERLDALTADERELHEAVTRLSKRLSARRKAK